MNYESLDPSYFKAQDERIQRLVEKINSRPELGEGRVVPDDDALSIGDGKRLQMAIMFIDICSFSNRRMNTQEEQGLMLKTLNLFFTEMIRISEEYGGNVEKNTGDGLMVYFNDGEGTPPEKGTKRALTCALTMLVTTERLINPILSSSDIDPIHFRVSIEYGAVTVAKIGAPRRFNAITAIGSAANFASKMLKRAGKNEIVLGAAAVKQLPFHWANQWAIKLEEPTEWIYRGTDEPYPLYKYVGRWITK